ncbi:hypothetical protein GMAR_ORF141 [Golden Marseillevirus]|uniref:hypothetical protein n=1 Tax=Golden Marseillevirus TaxID=1720526 RepID=UPI000877AF47|nr:hypothetical protein GMAR_ORF141 [Golden Marseillevirus]ALX27515.1 hypothetical protein GMAR_ORF141 [Golden Marseillevirus]
MTTWKSLDHAGLIEFVGNLLENNKISEKQISEALPSDKITSCRFKPQKGNGEVCGQAVAVPYGFCSKHKGTVQAKQAKDVYEKEQKEKEQKKESAPPQKEEQEPKKTAIAIRKNKFGIFQHTETGIIFGAIDKKAYGTQDANGKISPLSEKEIDYCERRGWRYTVPDEDNETEESGEEEESDEEEEESEEEDEESGEEDDEEEETEEEEEDD